MEPERSQLHQETIETKLKALRTELTENKNDRLNRNGTL
jgi:hypothetical protein